MTIENDNIKSLFSHILIRTVEDWFKLCRMEQKANANGKDGTKVSFERSNFKEIELFFKSQWGDTVCMVVGIDATDCLKYLRNVREMFNNGVDVKPPRLTTNGV